MLSSGEIVIKRVIKEGLIPLLLNQYNNESQQNIKNELIISFANLLTLKEEEDLDELFSLEVIDVICQTIASGLGDNDQNEKNIFYCMEGVTEILAFTTHICRKTTVLTLLIK